MHSHISASNHTGATTTARGTMGHASQAAHGANGQQHQLMSKSKSMAQMKSYRDNREAAKEQRPQRGAEGGVTNVDRMLKPQIQGGLAHSKFEGQSTSSTYQHQFTAQQQSSGVKSRFRAKVESAGPVQSSTHQQRQLKGMMLDNRTNARTGKNAHGNQQYAREIMYDDKEQHRANVGRVNHHVFAAQSKHTNKRSLRIRAKASPPLIPGNQGAYQKIPQAQIHYKDVEWNHSQNIGQRMSAHQEGQSGSSVLLSNKRGVAGASKDQMGHHGTFKQPQYNNFVTVGADKDRDGKRASDSLPSSNKPASQQPYSHKLSTVRTEHNQGQVTAVTSKHSSSQSNKYNFVRNHAHQYHTANHNNQSMHENRASTGAGGPASANTSFHPSSTSNSQNHQVSLPGSNQSKGIQIQQQQVNTQASPAVEYFNGSDQRMRNAASTKTSGGNIILTKGNNGKLPHHTYQPSQQEVAGNGDHLHYEIQADSNSRSQHQHAAQSQKSQKSQGSSIGSTSINRVQVYGGNQSSSTARPLRGLQGKQAYGRETKGQTTLAVGTALVNSSSQFPSNFQHKNKYFNNQEEKYVVFRGPAAPSAANQSSNYTVVNQHSMHPSSATNVLTAGSRASLATNQVLMQHESGSGSRFKDRALKVQQQQIYEAVDQSSSVLDQEQQIVNFGYQDGSASAPSSQPQSTSAHHGSAQNSNKNTKSAGMKSYAQQNNAKDNGSAQTFNTFQDRYGNNLKVIHDLTGVKNPQISQRPEQSAFNNQAYQQSQQLPAGPQVLSQPSANVASGQAANYNNMHIQVGPNSNSFKDQNDLYESKNSQKFAKKTDIKFNQQTYKIPEKLSSQKKSERPGEKIITLSQHTSRQKQRNYQPQKGTRDQPQARGILHQNETNLEEQVIQSDSQSRVTDPTSAHQSNSNSIFSQANAVPVQSQQKKIKKHAFVPQSKEPTAASYHDNMQQKMSTARHHQQPQLTKTQQQMSSEMYIVNENSVTSAGELGENTHRNANQRMKERSRPFLQIEDRSKPVKILSKMPSSSQSYRSLPHTTSNQINKSPKRSSRGNLETEHHPANQFTSNPNMMSHPSEPRDGNAPSLIGQSSSSTTTNKKQMMPVFSSNAANSLVLSDQHQLAFDGNSNYKQDDSKLQKMTSQISTSSKSPNTKQFQQHQQHLTHLFDTLKQRHMEEKRGQDEQLEIIQEQLEPALIDKAGLRHHLGSQKSGALLAQRSNRNAGMFEGCVLNQESMGHGHTVDSLQDANSMKKTSQRHQTQLAQPKNRNRNISKYESQEKFEQINIEIKNRGDKLLRKQKEIEEIAVEPISTTSQSSLLVIQQPGFIQGKSQQVTYRAHNPGLLASNPMGNQEAPNGPNSFLQGKGPAIEGHHKRQSSIPHQLTGSQKRQGSKKQASQQKMEEVEKKHAGKVSSAHHNRHNHKTSVTSSNGSHSLQGLKRIPIVQIQNNKQQISTQLSNLQQPSQSFDTSRASQKKSSRQYQSKRSMNLDGTADHFEKGDPQQHPQPQKSQRSSMFQQSQSHDILPATDEMLMLSQQQEANSKKAMILNQLNHESCKNAMAASSGQLRPMDPASGRPRTWKAKKQHTTHREVTSVDFNSGHKIQDNEIECHPLAVSLKISSSTKIKRGEHFSSKGHGLNTQASREQTKIDFVEQVIDDSASHRWPGPADDQFQIQKNFYMFAEKTASDDEARNVVRAINREGFRIFSENFHSSHGHKYQANLERLVSNERANKAGNEADDAALNFNQIEKTRRSENLEDSQRDIPSVFDMGHQIVQAQNLVELDKDGNVRQYSKSNLNAKSNQKFYINIEKIEKSQHSRRISEASAGLSRTNEKAKSNVDLRGKRTALEHHDENTTRAGQRDGGQPLSNHQSHAILSRHAQHMVKISDGGQELSKGSYQPAFTPIFNEYDIHSSKSSANGTKSQLSRAIMQIEDRCNQQAQMRPAPSNPSRGGQDQPRTAPEQFTNMDIFETMEKEMKQIMNLFAKERKSRKKEMSKLQAQLAQKDALIEELKRTHLQEKTKMLQKWRDDTKLHEQYQIYMDQKVKESQQRLLWHQQSQESQAAAAENNMRQSRGDQPSQHGDQYAQLMEDQHQINERLLKQERDFKCQLESKQYIIDESSQQIMNQAAQIDDMQSMIQQLQNERREQRARVESMAAQEHLIKQVVAPSHMILNHQHQVELSKRSQSLQRSNKKLNAINREIEISKFQLEKQNSVPNSVIVTPLNRHPEAVDGVLVIQDERGNYNTALPVGEGGPNLPVPDHAYATSYEVQDRIANDLGKQTDPSRNPDDSRANYSKDKQVRIIQSPVEEVMVAGHQELAINERQQYEQQIAHLIDQINTLNTHVKEFQQQKRVTHYRAQSPSEHNLFRMNSSIGSSPERSQLRSDLPLQQARDQQRGSSPPPTTHIIKPLQLQAQNSPQRHFNMSEKIQRRHQNSRSRSLKENEHNLATVSEEGDHSRSSNQAGAIQKNNSQSNLRPLMDNQVAMGPQRGQNPSQDPQERQERPNINPLRLDQLISQANTFGQNLENMESRLRQIDQMQLQSALMNSYSHSFQTFPSQREANHNGSHTHRVMENNYNSQSQITQSQPQMSGGSLLHGVQGGIDTQSLETILEFKDADLIGGVGVIAAGLRSGRGAGTDTVTSRLDNRDLRYYNNSSSLSNFVLPQTTYRTNKTNRSFKSGNGYGLMGAFGHNGRGGTMGGVSGVLTVNGHSGGHVGSISAIPQLHCNLTQNGAGQNLHLLNQLSAQRQQHNMSQRQPSTRSRDIYQSAGGQKTTSGSQNNQNSSSGGGNNNQQLSINVRQSQPLQTDQLATYRSHAVGTGLGLQQPQVVGGMPTGQPEHQAISMIFEEVQQNKRQLTQIMDFISRLKQQAEDDAQNPTHGGASGSGPPQDGVTSPSNDHQLLDTNSAAQGQSSRVEHSHQVANYRANKEEQDRPVQMQGEVQAASHQES